MKLVFDAHQQQPQPQPQPSSASLRIDPNVIKLQPCSFFFRNEHVAGGSLALGKAFVAPFGSLGCNLLVLGATIFRTEPFGGS